MAGKKIVHTRGDENGNEIRVYKDVIRLPLVLDVRLFIREKNVEKKLGLIDKNKRTLTIIKDRRKHLHYKSNSYGFNHILIKDALAFDVVLLKDELAVYKIPRHMILKHGDFLYFKEQGFERQIFVPLSILETFNIKENVF